MIGSISLILKRFLPTLLFSVLLFVYIWFKKVFKPIREVYFKFKIKKAQENYKKALEIVRQKEKIKVAFLMMNTDTWKYDSVYKQFEKDERFDPIVIIVPFIKKGDEFLHNELNKSQIFCLKENYNHFVAFDKVQNQSIDIKILLKPDIVFFSNPNALTTEEFLINNFLDALTCYVPYSFRIDSLYDYNYNNKMANLTWRNFYETSFHKNLATKYARNKGINVVDTGHPHLDKFLISDKTNIIDPWKKIDSRNRKRIIWGPHWTIKGYQNTGLDWACFLDYADYFFELAHEFEDEVQFAIKPHPFLRITLEKDELWGKNKTAEYYIKWKESKNMQLVDGDYLDLFKHSDALIHDSGAFMAEYLVLNKPSAYTINDFNLLKSFNDFGQSAFDVHTHIKNKDDLKKFIVDITNEYNELEVKRNAFVQEFFNCNRVSSSEKIVNHIKSML